MKKKEPVYENPNTFDKLWQLENMPCLKKLLRNYIKKRCDRRPNDLCTPNLVSTYIELKKDHLLGELFYEEYYGRTRSINGTDWM